MERTRSIDGRAAISTLLLVALTVLFVSPVTLVSAEPDSGVKTRSPRTSRHPEGDQAIPVRFTGEGTGSDQVAYLTISTTDQLKSHCLPLLKGRWFSQRDTTDTKPVVLVNRTLARRFWPSQNPVGKKIRLRLLGRDSEWEIVGVVGDRAGGFLQPTVFVPEPQSPYRSIVHFASGRSGRQIPVL